MNGRRRRNLLVLAVIWTTAAVLLVLVLTSGDSSKDPGVAPRVSPTPAVEAPADPAPEVQPEADRLRMARAEEKRLRRSFRSVADELPGSVGLAYATAPPERMVNLGGIRSGAAWSTIKPVLAAQTILDAGGTGRLSETQVSLISAALRASDNAAAMELWNQLLVAHNGSEATAAELEKVLAAAGDPETKVSTVGRDGFSPYGQTDWSLTAQAAFMGSLLASCVPGSAFLLDEMSNVIADQQWGLAEAGGNTFKGGWGPDPGGGYFVRQMGPLADRSKALGVAIAARPDDGQFATGISMLGTVAKWARSSLRLRPVTDCP